MISEFSRESTLIYNTKTTKKAHRSPGSKDWAACDDFHPVMSHREGSIIFAVFLKEIRVAQNKKIKPRVRNTAHFWGVVGIDCKGTRDKSREASVECISSGSDPGVFIDTLKSPSTTSEKCEIHLLQENNVYKTLINSLFFRRL